MSTKPKNQKNKTADDEVGNHNNMGYKNGELEVDGTSTHNKGTKAPIADKRKNTSQKGQL